MNGNNESGNEASGNRWEAKPAEDAGSAAASEAEALPQVPVEVPVAAASVAAPVEPANASKLPAWVTRRALVATGTAAAFFLGGGGVGYALGANGNDHGDDRTFPARFDRDAGGFGPGQPPGGGQGNFQAPQQSQDDSGSDSGSDSGTSS